MAKLQIKNYLTRLGIEYEDLETKVLSLTDKEVEDSYIEKLVETYVQYRGAKKDLEKQDEIKDELYNLMSTMNPTTSKIKIIVLENKLGELAKTENEEKNINLSIGLYKTAYDALKTQELRNQYARSLQKQKPFNNDLQNLIIKNGGNQEKVLEVQEFNKGNFPTEVRKAQSKTPEYNVEYEDEDIVLFSKETIAYDNMHLFTDEVKKYLMYVKNLSKDHIGIGYDFYGDIKIIQMSKPEYRVALFQAVNQNMQEGEIYLGSIEENENGYYIIKDTAKKLAILEYEKRQKENKYKQGEEK